MCKNILFPVIHSVKKPIFCSFVRLKWNMLTTAWKDGFPPPILTQQSLTLVIHWQTGVCTSDLSFPRSVVLKDFEVSAHFLPLTVSYFLYQSEGNLTLYTHPSLWDCWQVRMNDAYQWMFGLQKRGKQGLTTNNVKQLENNNISFRAHEAAVNY